MASVESLHSYPLTGGSVRNLDECRIGKDGGLVSDRMFVLYEQSDDMEATSYSRVSIRQEPSLVQVEYSVDGYFMLPDGSYLSRSELVDQDEVTINEFGDNTKGADLGDTVAKFFSEFLDREVRLAYVGNKKHEIDRENRNVAPLHIVNKSSIEWTAENTGLDYDEVVRRFRPNIVISDDTVEPFEEMNWTSISVRSLGEHIKLHRPTARCMVPGVDSTSGENLKDIPKTYKNLPKSEIKGKQKPIFGMYGYVVDRALSHIEVGDLVLAN